MRWRRYLMGRTSFCFGVDWGLGDPTWFRTNAKATEGETMGQSERHTKTDRKGIQKTLLLMEEILHQLIGSLSNFLQGFCTFQVVHDFFHQQYFQTFQRFNWQSLASLFQQLEMQQPKRTATWKLVMFHSSTFLFSHTATSCLCVCVFIFFLGVIFKVRSIHRKCWRLWHSQRNCRRLRSEPWPCRPSRQIRAAKKKRKEGGCCAKWEVALQFTN